MLKKGHVRRKDILLDALRRSVNGVVDPSDPLSREVGLESDDDDENTLFGLTNLLDGFSYSGCTTLLKILMLKVINMI